MTEEQLNNLNVYELRSLARRIGVGAPTTKVKRRLIREILDISSGKQAKHVAKTRQGRPPKNFVGIGLTNVITEANTQYADHMPARYFALAQNTPKFTVGDVTNITGYVEYLPNHTAVIRPHDLTSNECIILPVDMADKYKLRAGDIVSCDFDPATMDTPAVCKEVLSVNNCPILEYSPIRPDYFDIRHIRPSENVIFKDDRFASLDIKHGQTIYVYGIDNNDSTISLINLISAVNKSRKLYINPAIVEKNKGYLDELYGVEKFISPIVADRDATRRILTLAINRARRIIESGERVVVVIDDVQTIASMDEDLYITKNLLSLTKCADSGSVTVIALMPNDGEINTMFGKLCDAKYTIDNDNLTKC